MDINDYREQIDRVDKQFVDLFAERMHISGEIGLYKKENRRVINDPIRERTLITEIANRAPKEIEEYTRLLYSVIFELSRSYQNRLIGTGTPLTRQIADAIEKTPKLFPRNPVVACQGVEGANSQIACDRMFKNANILFFSTFDAVFSAVEKGLCRYGVIPIENSTAGSVNTVYDLMMRHKFSIVRSVRQKIDHNLLAIPGAKIEGLKEIYSHQQAISQCGEFLKTIPGVKIIPCENTAVAAKMVAESGRKDVAALSSRLCTKYYALECLKSSVQD